jgi:hypothetical protein
MDQRPPDRKPQRPVVPHGVSSSAEVSLADFKAATEDPEVKKFLASAKAQGEKLEQQGFIHP